MTGLKYVILAFKTKNIATVTLNSAKPYPVLWIRIRNTDPYPHMQI